MSVWNSIFSNLVPLFGVVFLDVLTKEQSELFGFDFTSVLILISVIAGGRFLTKTIDRFLKYFEKKYITRLENELRHNFEDQMIKRGIYFDQSFLESFFGKEIINNSKNADFLIFDSIFKILSTFIGSIAGGAVIIPILFTINPLFFVIALAGVLIRQLFMFLREGMSRARDTQEREVSRKKFELGWTLMNPLLALRIGVFDKIFHK
jgi:hypothetical protein